MSKILFVDVETGGLNPSLHSLLSVGLAVWEDGKVIDSVEYFVSEKQYSVTAKAMEINKLNLADVYDKGIPAEELIGKIHYFTKKHFTEGGTFNKATIAGWNVGFDVAFLKELFVKKNKEYIFEGIFSHRNIDVAGIIAFYNLMGVFDKSRGIEVASLDSAMKYFNLSCDSRHSALGDTMVTINVFNKLYEASDVLRLSFHAIPVIVREELPADLKTFAQVLTRDS